MMVEHPRPVHKSETLRQDAEMSQAPVRCRREIVVDEIALSCSDLTSVIMRLMFFSNSEYINFNAASSAIRVVSVLDDGDA